MLTLAKEYPEEAVCHYFVPSAQGGEIVEHLANAVEEKDIAEGLGQAVRIMAQMKPDWPWQNFVNTVNQVTNAMPVLLLRQWQDILEALWNIRCFAEEAKARQAETVLQQIAKDGRTFHYLHISLREEDWKNAAWNLLTLLRLNPNGQQQRVWQNSNDGLQQYRQILQNPSRHSKIMEVFAPLALQFLAFDDVLNIYQEHRNTKGWIEAFLEKMLEDKPEFISPTTIVKEGYLTFQQFPQDLQDKMIRKIGSGLVHTLVEADFDAEYASLYERILEVLESPGQSFLAFLRDGLQNVDKEKWTNALENQDDLWVLLHSLLEKDFTPELGPSFSDALLDWAKAIMNQEIEISEEEIPLYASLPNALDSASRETFWMDLLDLFLRNPEQDWFGLLDVFGEGLTNAKDLPKKSDEIVRTLFRVIMDNGAEKDLRWMFRTLKKRGRSILNRTSIAPLQVFAERLENLKGKEISEDIRADADKWIKKVETQIAKRNS